jgi:glycosyl transferase family 2
MNIQTGISVLIRTKNSSGTLGQVLQRLGFTQNDELLIVDSGSTDDTLCIAKRYNAAVIRVEGPFNYSRSLNVGFEAATKPWVLVLSSHSIPCSANYLHDLRGAIAELPGKVAVVYGRSTLVAAPVAKTSSPPPRFVDSAEWEKQKLWAVGNGNALYQRASWQNHRFDESLVTAEDLEWFLWALRNGLIAVELTDALVVYRNQGSLRHMFAKGLNESKAFREMVGPSPMPRSGLFIGLAALVKKVLFGRISVATFLRQSAHHYGAFVGSRRST